MLFKQYTDAVTGGGAAFLDFGIDPDFGNCGAGVGPEMSSDHARLLDTTSKLSRERPGRSNSCFSAARMPSA